MTRNSILRLIRPESEKITLWSIWKENFFGNPKQMTLTLELPKYELCRLQTFVDDLVELSDHEFDYSLENLIAIVYQDFLVSVRKGKIKIPSFTERMLKMHQLYRGEETESVLQPINEYRYQVIQVKVPNKNQLIYYPVPIDKTKVLRGEVLLMDMFRYYKEDAPITLSELISYLLIDFAEDLRKGNTRRVSSMLKTLRSQ